MGCTPSSEAANNIHHVGTARPTAISLNRPVSTTRLGVQDGVFTAHRDSYSQSLRSSVTFSPRNSQLSPSNFESPRSIDSQDEILDYSQIYLSHDDQRREHYEKMNRIYRVNSMSTVGRTSVSSRVQSLDEETQQILRLRAASRESARTQQTERRVNRRRGLKKNELAQFKPFIYIEEHIDMLVNTNCSICLEDFEVGDKLVSLTCSQTQPHTFHAPCIHLWLKKCNSCPLCKQFV